MDGVLFEIFAERFPVVEIGFDLGSDIGGAPDDAHEALSQLLDGHLSGEAIGMEHGLERHHLEALGQFRDLEVLVLNRHYPGEAATGTRHGW